MIEAKLESQIIQALAAQAAPGVWFSGAWNPAADGAVKGSEPEGVETVVAVTVSPRVMDDYNGGDADCVVAIPVSVGAYVRGELDATGASTLALYCSIFGKIWGLVKSQTSDASTILTVEEGGVETFTPGGVLLTGGNAPTWDAQTKSWSFSLSFTVKGVSHD